MNIKAIIFDKDGTLIDFDSFWIPISRGATEDILKEIKCSSVSPDEVLSALGVEDGISNADGVLCTSTYSKIGKNIHDALLKCGYNFDEEKIEKLALKAFAENVHKGDVKGTCPNIREVLSDIKKEGIRIFVATSDRFFTTKKCLEELNIYDLFDGIYTDDGDVPPKPNPDCIYDIMEKHCLTQNEIIMVGDTQNDLNFAKNGNIKLIGVAKGKKNMERFLRKTDIVFPDISYLLNYLKENRLL